MREFKANCEKWLEAGLPINMSDGTDKSVRLRALRQIGKVAPHCGCGQAAVGIFGAVYASSRDDAILQEALRLLLETAGIEGAIEFFEGGLSYVDEIGQQRYQDILQKLGTKKKGVRG